MSDSGAGVRASAAATTTLPAPPAWTVRIAASSALVPARAEPPKSAVNTRRGRSHAVATTAATCFSQYGALALAKYRPSTPSCCPPRSEPTASHAIVNASSS